MLQDMVKTTANPIKSGISHRLRLLRVSHTLRQYEAAQLIDVHQSTWAFWESEASDRLPSTLELMRIEEIFGAPVEWLMWGITSRMPSWLSAGLIEAEGQPRKMKPRRGGV